MKKITSIIGIVIMIFGFLPVSLAENESQNKILITFKDKVDRNLIVNLGGKITQEFTILENTIAVEIPSKAIKGLINNPNIKSIESDITVSILGKGGNKGKPTVEAPNQPDQVIPWGISQIGVSSTSLNTGMGSRVCIIDTGIDKDHLDLQENIITGKNFIGKGRKIDPNKFDDDNGHGTHVAGTIAALNNGIGVIGVAPNADLIIVKALDSRGSGSLSNIIAGIDYCVSQNADIISMSLGTNSNIASFKTAVDNTYNLGLIIVAAAGNDYNSPVSYPAAYGSVIAVSSTESDNSLSSFSNIGPEIELAAPGRNILSTWNDGLYHSISGTSMATPHVAGVVALAINANPSMSNSQIRNLLQITADDLGIIGKDNFFGYGLVDSTLN